jgi:hypothetical protein
LTIARSSASAGAEFASNQIEGRSRRSAVGCEAAFAARAQAGVAAVVRANAAAWEEPRPLPPTSSLAKDVAVCGKYVCNVEKLCPKQAGSMDQIFYEKNTQKKMLIVLPTG